MSVNRHLCRERNSKSAVLSKQSDDFLCIVGRFAFRSSYRELGEDLAQAHHVARLAKDNRIRVTTVDDLVTMCGNCRKIDHKMAAEAVDGAKLRSMVHGKIG